MLARVAWLPSGAWSRPRDGAQDTVFAPSPDGLFRARIPPELRGVWVLAKSTSGRLATLILSTGANNAPLTEVLLGSRHIFVCSRQRQMVLPATVRSGFSGRSDGPLCCIGTRAGHAFGVCTPPLRCGGGPCARGVAPSTSRVAPYALNSPVSSRPRRIGRATRNGVRCLTRRSVPRRRRPRPGHRCRGA